MYFILKNDPFSGFESSLTEPTGFPREVNFISGKRITMEIDEPLVFTTTAKIGDTMVDFSKGSVTLMSNRFLEMFVAAGVNNLQVFPAIVRSEIDGTVWRNYFAVNVLGIISCADLSKSSYDKIMPGHYVFDELAIYTERLNDVLLFRLQEHSPSIIIHKSVLKYLVDNDPNETLLGWEADDIIQ